jgi:hypothetical protein
VNAAEVGQFQPGDRVRHSSSVVGVYQRRQGELLVVAVGQWICEWVAGDCEVAR